MGMSEWYGATDWDESIATINRALDLGVTFIDTADIYGAGHNEVLVGRGIAHRRDEVQLAASSASNRSAGDAHRVVRGEHDYVKRSCEEASLTRLGVEVIDLYYLHLRRRRRPRSRRPVGAMAELVAEGKQVRYLGLSEVDDKLLRRAYAVHPIAAVQSRTRSGPEDFDLEASRSSAPCADLHLASASVPYSPLGRGFLTNAPLDLTALDDRDFRRRNPRFRGQASQDNQAIAGYRQKSSRGQGTCRPRRWRWPGSTPQEERLGVPVAPIPGTKRIKWLEQNVAALDITLTADELALLDPLAAQVTGARY